MSKEQAIIIDTGCANVASVRAAFFRLGHESVVTRDAATINGATLLILPGVGAFGNAMPVLAECGIDQLLRNRIQQGRPLLAICLGMQLLAERSQESQGAKGLGVIHQEIVRFQGELRIPQMGWNQVTCDPANRVLASDFFYFANSYCMIDAPQDWNAAMSHYGTSFVAGLERGPIVACQFHPELSGRAGLELLRRWVEVAEGEPASC